MQEAGTDGKAESAKAWRREDQMSTLHQIAPVFFLMQFLVVLMALIAATRMADPQLSLPSKKLFRRLRERSITGSRN